MSLVGIPEMEQKAVFQTVAAVLHLGNVAFVDGAEQDSSQVPAGAPTKRLEAAAQLLGVPAQGLSRALTTRTRQTTDGAPLLRAGRDSCLACSQLCAHSTVVSCSVLWSAPEPLIALVLSAVLCIHDAWLMQCCTVCRTHCEPN